MIPGKAPLRLRLAKLEEPGATLYNAYNFLTLLSTLYAQAAQFETRNGEKARWRELCDSALTDLGEVYHVWDVILRDQKAGKGTATDAAFWDVVARACRRVEFISDRVDVWTPMNRWAQLLSRGESRWQKIVARVSDVSPVLTPKLEAVARTSLDRGSLLKGMIEMDRLEARRIQECFRGGSPDDSSGSMGF